MNSGFYKDLDTNFEQAFKMAESTFSHEDLVAMLSNGNIPQKQLAALRLEKVNNQTEADILVSNLTGCDGKIREAVALKIQNLLSTNPNCFVFFNQAEVFADATIDINANICRLVIDAVSILKQDKEFSKIYLDRILEFLKTAFEELDKLVFRDKKYIKNKQLFKIYWCLESLRLFVNELEKEKLLEILKRASTESEYTIREKAAQIAILTDFEEIKNRLAQDENYYVKEVFGKVNGLPRQNSRSSLQ